jgi:hypothetical protein
VCLRGLTMVIRLLVRILNWKPNRVQRL